MSKRLMILLLIISGSSISVVFASDCSDASSYADDTYSYARRGYNSYDIDEAEQYARRAMSSAEDTMSAAGDCGCDDAYSAADDAYTYARRAYNSGDFDDAVDYLRKARNAADDAISYADSCN